MTKKVGPLDVDEEKVLRFRFVDELPSGNTLQSAAVTVDLKFGTDATPASLLVGAASIDGSDVLQRVRGRAAGAGYHLRCQATDDNGQKHVIACDLDTKRL